jgi:hypothetical protein
MKKTYDVVFTDSKSADCKGFKESLTYCKNYIRRFNGTNHSYFADYKGGIIAIVCNETNQVVFNTKVL